MNARETREAAAAEQRYQAGPEAETARIADRTRRAKADVAAGHSTRCSLTKCASECSKAAAA